MCVRADHMGKSFQDWGKKVDSCCERSALDGRSNRAETFARNHPKKKVMCLVQQSGLFLQGSLRLAWELDPPPILLFQASLLWSIQPYTVRQPGLLWVLGWQKGQARKRKTNSKIDPSPPRFTWLVPTVRLRLSELSKGRLGALKESIEQTNCTLPQM